MKLIAKKLIEENFSEQWLRCRVCAEVKEIPRALLRDQHELMVMVDDMRHDHRECAENPENPRLAMSQRLFRKAIERESAPKQARRCSHRPTHR